LTPVEAHRIVGVIEECLEKLSFLSSLQPASASSVGPSGPSGGGGGGRGDEVRRQMEELKDLEQRYDALILAIGAETAGGGKCPPEEQAALDEQYERLLGSLDASSSHPKARVAALKGELSATSVALRNSMKQLLLLLKASPNDASLAHISEERAWLVGVLEGAGEELRRDASYHRLAATLVREEEACEAPKRVEAREAALHAEVGALATTLAGEAAAHEEAMAGKLKALKLLQDALAREKEGNKVALRFARKDGAAGVEVLKKALGQGSGGLREELAATRAAGLAEGEVHDTSKALLQEEATLEAEEGEKWKRRLGAEVPVLTEELAKALEEKATLMEALGKAQARYEEELTSMASKRVSAMGGGCGGRFKGWGWGEGGVAIGLAIGCAAG